MSLKDRIDRLETKKGDSPLCPQCGGVLPPPRPIQVIYQGDPRPEPEKCPHCGAVVNGGGIFVIEVVSPLGKALTERILAGAQPALEFEPERSTAGGPNACPNLAR